MQLPCDRSCKTRIRGNMTLSRSICIATAFASLWFAVHAATVRAQNISAAQPKNDPPKTRADSRNANCRIIYLGIVGALEPPNNKHSGVVQIRDTLSGPEYPDVCARSVSPYNWIQGLHWLLKHFPAHPGRLTDEELARIPKVILVGHSAGGWAVLGVARDLRRRNIPVELMVQVDSVGVTDHTVPRNVKAAAIFHARDVMMPLTTKSLRLEDSTRTKIVANVLVKGAGHWSITRDPRIRNLVIDDVDSLRTASASPDSSDSQSQP